jgi:hypothetical protein
VDLNRQPASFTRTVEDFTCGQCGLNVRGNGYTNHCPGCLWSRHVDVDPGDRAATCGGMMTPVGVECVSGQYVLTHRCTTCHFERRNRTAAGDDFSALLALARG